MGVIPPQLPLFFAYTGRAGPLATLGVGRHG
jgi:hypothetical protein